MKRKIIVFQIILALLLIISGSTSYAAKSATIRGILQSDKVELRANLDAQKEEIAPGSRAKQILVISNMGTDCYLRVTPKIKNNKIGILDLQFDNNSDWVLKNDSFYYTKVLKRDKSLEFCESIMIPEKFSFDELSIEYSIDAIQSDNFTPVFDSLNPWGNVDIISVKNRGKSITLNNVGTKEPERDFLEIHYNDEAKSLITNFDEIFTDVPLLKPGDEYNEEIRLKNNGKVPLTLYFSDITDDSEILKYVDIDIVAAINDNEKEIFSGSLGETTKDKKLNAGTLLPGEEEILVISANMSKDADNSASSLSSHLTIETWAEEAVGEKEEIGTVTEKEEKKDLQVKSAKTGDDFSYGFLLIIAGIMLIAGVVFLERKE